MNGVITFFRAAGLAALWAALSAFAHASDQALAVRNVDEILASWNPQQHVYVKGRLGVSNAKLEGLEQWIDQHAPNWTVVLMQDARNERFVDAEGQAYRGMDAVEHALGKTLPNQTAFGEFKHPATGQASGAYFILFLQERKLSYHASEVYDARRLGEAHWIGNLDGPAIRAMRSGARVADAARDTIAHIEQQLARKLTAEEAERKRVELHARQVREQTAALIQTAREDLGFAERKASELRVEYDNPGGDLAHPPLPEWEQQLTAAETFHANEEIAEAGRRVLELRSRIGAYLSQLDAHAAAVEGMATLEQEIDNAKLHEDSMRASTRAMDLVSQAREALASARTAHSACRSEFRTSLEGAGRLLQEALAASVHTARQLARLDDLRHELSSLAPHPKSGNAQHTYRRAATALESAERAHQQGEHDFSGHLEAAEQQLAQTRRANLVKTSQLERARVAAWTGGSVATGALVLLALIGNRRRRDEREEAMDLLSTWDRALKEKLDGLFALHDRAAVSVGSAAELDERGYTGETLETARAIIKDIDELFIMSSLVDRLFEDSRRLIEPPGLGGQLVNLVLARRYLRAIRLLRDEPVRFEAGDQLETIIKGKRNEWSGLLGKREDYAPFQLSFEELVAAFNQRAERALSNLDLLDDSWESISGKLGELESQLDAVEAAEAELAQHASEDLLFPLASTFAELLPAAEDLHQEGVTMGASDPVKALRLPIAKGMRQANDAAALIGIAQGLRADLLPGLEASGEALRTADRQDAWIGRALTALSETAENLGRAALTGSQAEPISRLKQELHDLAEAAAECVALETRAAKESLPTIGDAAQRVATARQALGDRLEVSAECVLREPDLDPSQRLAEARGQVAAARAALDRGAVLAARAALASAHDLTTEAGQIVEATEDAAAEYPQRSESLFTEWQDLQEELRAAEQQANSLSARYAPAALVFRDPVPHLPPEEQDTLAGMRVALAHHEDAGQRWEEAREAHKQARLLDSAHLLEQSRAHSTATAELIALIHAHGRRLEKVELENEASFAELQERREACRALVDRPHVMQPTRTLCQEAQESLASSWPPPSGPGERDPFATDGALAAVAERFDQVEAMEKSDHAMYEEAQRSVTAAMQQLQASRILADRARADRIPDSPEMISSLQATETLPDRLEELQQSLATPHQDWNRIDAEADQIAAEAARHSALLKGELRRGEEAVAAVASALLAIRKASAWSGRYGIRIMGSPGRSSLHHARELLATGDYLAAHRWAQQARRKAQASIDKAEAEVRAERRRRQRAELSSSSSSSLFSSSRSSFGSSSSFGRSSFGGGSSFGGSSRSSFSSGSGTSRSGW